jgi:hypothetical protein
MEMLHQKLLKENIGVRLAINPTTLRAAFPDPKPVFWNPPKDRYAYGRTSRKFLPHDRGGEDDTGIFDAYIREQLPSDFKINLPELQGEEGAIAINRLMNLTKAIYLSAFIETNPRERIQRGQFKDALLDLIDKQSRFGRSLELLRHTENIEEEIRQWCLEAKELYDRLGRTALIADKIEKANAVAAAQAQIEDLWRDRHAVVLMISRVSMPVCKAEATYLISVCKHEEAERAQTRAEYATGEDSAILKQQAIEAWQDARGAWRTYNEGNIADLGNFPGRAAQAQMLAARAEKFASLKP